MSFVYSAVVPVLLHGYVSNTSLVCRVCTGSIAASDDVIPNETYSVVVGLLHMVAVCEYKNKCV